MLSNSLSRSVLRLTRVAGAAISFSVALVLVVAGSAGASSVTMAMSTPTSSISGSVLQSVSCPTSSFCMAVGDQFSGGNVSYIGEQWNGTVWRASTPVTPASGGVYLFSVSCASASFCMAVGSASETTPLAEEWNGTSWSVTSVPLPSSAGSGTFTSFASVSCPLVGYCMAVGAVTAGSQGSYTGRTLAEEWNGASWSVVATPDTSQPNNALSGVSCSSASFCMAVGSGADYSASPEISSVLAAEWNGTSWAQVSAPDPGSNDTPEEVSCPAPTFCMTVGTTNSGTGVLVEVWDGSTWSTAPSLASVPLAPVACSWRA